METVQVQARAPWNLRQVLWALLLITLLEFGLNLTLNLSVQSVMQLALWELLDALLYVGGIYIFLSWKLHLGWGALGLQGKKLARSLLVGTIAGLATVVLALVVGNLIVKLVGHQPSLQPVEELAQKATMGRQTLLLLITGSLVVPIKEEVLFRGFVYPAFRNRAGVAWGIALTSLVFAFAHADLMRFVPLLLAGVILNLAYVKTESLYASIIGHGVWNLGMTLLAVWWR